MLIANCWFSAKVFRIIPLQFIILISSTMQTGCRTKTYSLKSSKNFFTFDWVVKRSNGNSVTIATLQRPLKQLWHANSPIKLTIKLTETIKPAAKSLMYILMAQQIRKKSKKKINTYSYSGQEDDKRINLFWRWRHFLIKYSEITLNRHQLYTDTHRKKTVSFVCTNEKRIYFC